VTLHIALLRGVNVGGRSSLPMASLREVAGDLGYDDVRTYIQSGNLLCRTPKGAATVERELQQAIAERCGVTTDVIVRTRAQLAKVVAGNPFLARGADPKHLHVVFTAAKAKVPLTDLERYAPEEVQAIGKELYLLLPNGAGRSKLAVDLGRKAGAGVGTMRNWNTVRKLLAMADGG
jgi:uncharacterized protein (DUF1697 family)